MKTLEMLIQERIAELREAKRIAEVTAAKARAEEGKRTAVAASQFRSWLSQMLGADMSDVCIEVTEQPSLSYPFHAWIVFDDGKVRCNSSFRHNPNGAGLDFDSPSRNDYWSSTHEAFCALYRQSELLDAIIYAKFGGSIPEDR